MCCVSGFAHILSSEDRSMRPYLSPRPSPSHWMPKSPTSCSASTASTIVMPSSPLTSPLNVAFVLSDAVGKACLNAAMFLDFAVSSGVASTDVSGTPNRHFSRSDSPSSGACSQPVCSGTDSSAGMLWPYSSGVFKKSGDSEVAGCSSSPSAGGFFTTTYLLAY